ncbi:MAG: HAD family phosphatase [Verrucomicrobia bacterium]|nr:HAD family phosphatase [Verrucomicrobiota bacterium]
MKGCICLDIDGTTTVDPHFIQAPVLECLRFLYKQGWQFAFLTGRTYSFALKTLRDVDFPFFFAVQNGSDLLHMPDGKLLSRAYLPSDIVFKLEEVCKGKKEDFIIYSGWEMGDFCYYRPKNFSPKILEHIGVIECFSKEPWHKVEEFRFPLEQAFPLIKYLGSKEEMVEIYELIKTIPNIAVSCIKDPIPEDVYLNLITAPDALKGNCLRKIRSYFPKGTLFIAAGDDYNDVSMLKEADIAIVMENAPEALKPLADIRAKSAKDLGIIEALLQATKEKR